MHLGDAEFLRNPALRHVFEEPHVEDGALAIREMPKAGLGCFAVGDDVVGALGCAEPVDEEGVLAGQQPCVEGERVVAVDGLQAVPDLVLGQTGALRDATDAGFGPGPGLLAKRSSQLVSLR
ncbi:MULTISPECIES: hypothetical protein [unclassified Streptomyces]|uniref:hypothetical protein n=1 Tax=unclassified Streptomyces TaxID=2593676 RepID=UPI0036DFDC23